MPKSNNRSLQILIFLVNIPGISIQLYLFILILSVSLLMNFLKVIDRILFCNYSIKMLVYDAVKTCCHEFSNS